MSALLATQDDSGCFFVFVIIAVIIVAIIYSTVRTNRMNEALQRLAGRLDGRVTDGGFLVGPTLEFTLAGRRARFEFYPGSKNSSPYSKLEVTLADPAPGTLHILPEGFGQSFLKLFGAQDLEVGDPRFDADYVIKASPESLAANLFVPTRRDRVIASVRRLSNFNNATIDLERFRLSVQIREYCTDDGRLMAMVHTAEDFLKYLFGTPPPSREPGIVWGEMQTLAGGECPVCGTAMREFVIRCEACRTPHHQECWEYAGKCSTFGCAGRRFVA